MNIGMFSRRELGVLAAAILASGISFLDGTVVNVAIPTIQAYFNADVGTVFWIINAFFLFEGCLLLISGVFSDRFGHRRIFLYGILLFGIASVLCGFAQSISTLIICRALQGIGSALMVPGSLSLIRVNTREKLRNRAIGLWSGAAGAFSVAGPFLGGFLIEHVSWRAIFFINVPIVCMAVFLTLWVVPESATQKQGRVDWYGVLFLFCGLFFITYALMRVPTLGWRSVTIVVFISLGLAILGFFFKREGAAKDPLIRLEIFRLPLVLGANLVTFLLYFALNSVMFFMMLNLQQLQGFTPAQAGLLFLPGILLITLLSGVGGLIADRIGPRLPMIVGPLLFCLGVLFLLPADRGANYLFSFFPALICIGLGMSLIIAPLTNSALLVPNEYTGAASGANNGITSLAALLSVALLGALVVPLFSLQLQKKLSEAALRPEEAQQIQVQAAKFGDIEIPPSFNEVSSLRAKEAIQSSFVYSFRVMMCIDIALGLLSSLVAVVYIHSSKNIHK